LIYIDLYELIAKEKTLRQENLKFQEVMASAAQNDVLLHESLQQNGNLQQKIEQLTQKENEWIRKENEWIRKENEWIQKEELKKQILAVEKQREDDVVSVATNQNLHTKRQNESVQENLKLSKRLNN